MVATWYEDDSLHLYLPNSQPCFGGSEGCARGTGKAGENGQHSGEMGGSSPWTRPSAPGCGDTLKAPSDQRLILCGDGSSSKTAPGSLSTGSPAGRAPLYGDGSMYSQAFARIDGPSVAVRDRGRCCGNRMGPLKVTPRRVCFGWKGGRSRGAPHRSPKTTSTHVNCVVGSSNAQC